MTPRVLSVAVRGVRFFLAVIAVLVLCFGPAPNTAAAPTTNALLVHGYTYDCNRSSESCDAAAEPGPPVTRERGTTHETVDCWAHGVLACPDGTSPGTTTRITDARFVRVAPATARTRESSGVADAGLAVFDRPGVATNAERVAINGETTATRLGRQMPQEWDYGPGYVKEFTLRAGGRPDAINFETRHIFELKPNNPRAIRLGERQIEGYLAKLNEQFPGEPWTGDVVTYGP